MPTQASLNLVISERRVLSLPVSDREALICDDGSLSTETTPASGRLIVNGSELTWTGSLTGRTADSYVYGNGNIVVRSERDPVTGTSRVLDEASRRTPDMPSGSGMVDVGFMATDNGGFRSTSIASNGGVDIFRHDLVVRCPANRIDPHRENRMQIAQIGRFTSGSLPEFAVTAGPSLDYGDFASHPINTDASLGDSPPFLEQRKARMLFYQEPEGNNHLLLFDGRPGSRTFQGATPSEVQEIVASGSGYRWGCFLDSGQTAKLWVTERDGSQRSFGNRHYLGWPREEGGRFTWMPDQGRPMPSFITFHPRRNTLLTPATGLRDMLKKPLLQAPSGTARRPDSQKPAASPRLPPPGQPRRGAGHGPGA